MNKKHTTQSFWARTKVTPSGCMEWQGCTNVPDGYGLVRWNRKQRVAHRVAAYLSGMVDSVEAPANKQEPTHVLHSCDNKRCCNPKHLYLGSYSDNLKDAYKSGLKKPACGERKNSKLTAATALEIFVACHNGAPRSEMASKHNVSKSMVDKIVNRQTWNHITKEYLT